jgi:hypothetical protein
VTTVAGAATPALRRRLIESPGAGSVVHAGPQALYLLFADRVIGVVARGAVHVPAAIAVTLPRLPQTEVGAPAEIRDGVLRVAGLTVTVGRLVPAEVPRIPASAAARLETALPDLDVVRRQLPASALAALARGEAAAVLPLLGRGDGLTPVGDDVLAGWLVTARAVGRDLAAVRDDVLASSHRTTALSATLLAHAAAGEAIPEFRSLLLALAGAGSVAPAVARQVAVGHTSGAGMLLGAWLALDPTEGNPR